ncbi:MAG: PAS domain S-box protein [Microcoleus sp. PH2017_29_MFU_D_A]|uniref:PAS domain S-box protein n=1 Tax=unclassified Microcoleus TaxID=2642155 RepID=UPI001DEC5AA2|nr:MULTISPECIES: PAS domain S-box protein [unclassified Microcoleus]MCC3453153.1 PAS domain S-box protein [Microcoleus sp. PH2017_08_TRC_O_A]MCC3602164.1 PAS domain S-box protein [Microcoleus sp. PH2017_29_MFU_D_A]MCC3633396.1 PAS domain S-box protein [Microcoleus sp. PH2017_37_MFU_D_B]TAE57418.1 MAG: PAS domain S-box protein [Oscillatoriales cyanobacterium]
MNFIYSSIATTFTLTLPDFSISLVAGIANCIICFCYFAIASLISLGLWRNRQFGFDIFATVTAAIFWSCAFGHSGHAAEYLGLPHSHVAQTVSDWITVIPAIAFLSLSNRYQFLVGSTQILTSKKATEQALSETTQRFQAIFDQAFQLIALLNPDGTLIEANQTALELGDLEPSEVLGLKFWHTPWWASSPTNQQRLKTNIKQVSAGKFVREEYEITGANNQVTVIDISFKPLLNETGEVFQILAEGRDITARKQTEAKLQQLTAELEQRVNDRTEQIQQTNALLQQEVRDRTAVQEQLKASEQFLNNIINTIPDPIYVKDEQHRWLALNDAFCQYIGRSRSELIGKAYRDFLPKEQADIYEEKNQLVFWANTSSETQETITEPDGNTRFLSVKKSTFVDAGGSKVLVCAIREITNRVRMEEQLRETLAEAESSQNLLRTVIDATPDLIFVKDRNFRYSLVNAGFAAAFGKTQAEMLGKDDLELNVPTEQIFGNFHTQTDPQRQVKGWRADDTAVLNGQEVHNPNDIASLADGKVHIFDTQKSPLKDAEGKILGVLGFSRDITQRRESEQELLRLKAILETTTDWVGMADSQQRSIYLNRAAREMLRVGKDSDLAGISISDVTSPKSMDTLMEVGIPAACRDGVWSGETIWQTLDGEEIPVSQVIIAHKSQSGEVEFMSTIARNITERKRTEQALQQNLQMLDLASDALIVRDIDGTINYWNQGAQRMYGFTKQEALGQLTHTLFHTMFPQPLEIISAQLAERDYWEGELIHTTKYHTKITVFSRWNLQRDEQGKPKAILETNNDITGRKQSEIENQRLRSIVESSSDFIGMATMEGEPFYLNSAGIKLVGLNSPEELKTKNTGEFFFPEDLQQFTAEIMPCVMETGSWRGEFRLKHFRTGDRIPVDYSVFTVKHPETGEPMGLATVTRDISDRKRAEEMLRDRERLFRAIFDQSLQFMGLLEPDGTVLEINQTALLAAEVGIEEVVGKPFWETPWWQISPEVKQQVREAVAKAAAGEVVRYEAEVLLTGGFLATLDFSLKPIKDESDKVVLLIPEGRDLSDRKALERELSLRQARFDAFFAAAPAGMFITDDQLRFMQFNEKLAELGGQPASAYIGKTLWEAEPEMAPVLGPLYQQVLSTNEPILNLEVSHATTAHPDVVRDWLSSYFPLPGEDGKPLGIGAFVLEVTDRKALERELVLRQSRFDAFFAASPASMFIFDEQLRFVQVNESLAETTGVSVAEHLGKTVREVIPEMVDTLQPILQGVLANNQPLLNIEVAGTTVNQPGVIRDWLASYFPLAGEDGKPIGVGGVAIEITDRKKAEAERDRFFTLSLDLLCIADFEGKFKRLNPAWAKTLGYTVEELQNQSFIDFVHAEDVEKTLAETAKVAGGAETISFENRYRCKDGSYKWLSWKSRPLIEEKIMYAVARDITESKQTISQLQETTAQLARSEEEFRGQSNLLQLLINSISDGVVAADANGNFVLFNPAATNMFGSGSTDALPNEWAAKYGVFLPDTVTPYPTADIPLVRTLRGESVDDVDIFTRHAAQPEGLWVKINGRPLKDETGAIKGGVVVCRNVTQEKASQQQMQQLAEAQERLLQELKTRQNALDEAAIVSETDLKGIITYVNERFTQISGFSMGELLHRDHRIVNSGYHPKAFFSEMWLTISRGLVWKGEIKNRRKDGSFYWVDSTIAPIFDTSGTIVKYIAIRFDITERKEAEEGLEKFAAERKAEADSMTQQVLKLLGEIKGAAQGDLTVRAEVTNDVLGAVADSFNFLIGSLRKVVTGIQTLAEQVTSATGESINNTSELTQQAEVQAEKISAIMREIERIVNSIRDVRDVSVRAETVAQQSSHTAEVGGMAVDRAVEGINELRLTIASTSKMMKRLGESSQQIGKIVTSISQLASQTNLLALNATIEAARAGEQGLGFAVVAEEVRKLAERSAGATEEISEIVGTIQEEISRVMKAMESGTLEVVEGTKLASEAKTHLNAIIEVSREMNALVQNITRASAKQTVSAEEISNSMQQVNEIANTTAQKGSDVKASLDDLSGSVSKLQKSVANFRS